MLILISQAVSRPVSHGTGSIWGASCTYSYGGEVINFQDYYLFNMEGSSNQYAIAADRYVSDMNPGRNNVPVATRISVTNQSLKLSSYYVEDASYFRCSNITLATRSLNVAPENRY